MILMFERKSMTKIWRTLICATALLLPAAASANIVYNGGFELGDFTGWILSGNPIPGIVDTSNPHSGNYAADLDAAGSPGYIEQSLPTTPGTQYTLTYYLDSDGGTPSEFLTQIDNTTLFDQRDIPGQNYTHYAFSFQAAKATTDLKFGFQDDPGSLYLDDISVTSAPEPDLAWVGLLLAGLAIARQVKCSKKGSI